MNKPLKITRIGNSAGVILPKEVLAKLRAEVGDSIYLSELQDGLKMTVHDPEFEKQMEIARQIMRENRDVLRALAK